MQQHQMFERNMAYQSPVNSSLQTPIDYQTLWGEGVGPGVRLPPTTFDGAQLNNPVTQPPQDRPLQMAGFLPFVISKVVPEQTKIKIETWVKNYIQQWITLGKKHQCIINFVEGEKLAGDEEIIHKTIIIPFENLRAEVKNACETLIKMKESKELDFEKDYENLKTSYDLLCKLQFENTR